MFFFFKKKKILDHLMDSIDGRSGIKAGRHNLDVINIFVDVTLLKLKLDALSYTFIIFEIRVINMI